jgi:pullulanase-type alpha-1,6-glucosidase
MHPLESRFRGGAPQLALLSVLLLSVFNLAAPAAASDTPAPHSVTVAGSLQSEAGCPDDWQPGCATTHLAFSADDNVWQGTFNLPAGDFEYKGALNDAWSENYGLHAVSNGANIPLHLSAAKAVKFYYDHESHWVTDNQSSVIATAPGSFQHFLGCSGDWQPDCLRSWLEDPDGDGIYTFSTHSIPAGSYEVKAAINESWDENYGVGGTPGGANIAFTVASDCATTVFSYDAHTHILTVTAGGAAPQPNSVTVAGSLQSELGCSDDWQPACATTHLGFDNTDGIWEASFNVPAGNWEYKAPLNDSWDVNYGLHAQPNGSNIPLNLSAAKAVKFYFDNGTHWITDNQTSVIATVAGSFQSELGCPGDWQPDCLRSWLQDPDGDGIYTFTARTLPAGNYEAKVAINESWDENYGANGAPNGANITFSVPRSCTDMFFSYDSHSHVLTISASGAPNGNITRAQAYWVSRDTIAWKPGGTATVQPDSVFALSYDPAGGLILQSSGVSGGTSIPLAWDPAGLTAAELDKQPQLAGYPTFKIPAAHLAEVQAALKGQTAVSATAGDGTLIDATALQIQGVLDDLYTYDGSLGLTFNHSIPTLRVWAPTAQSVKLHVFDTSTTATDTVVPMTVDPATGVWKATGAASWYGKYYLYEVKVWARSTGKVETNLVTDPYSISLSRNSQRSQIIDLAGDRTLQPDDWNNLDKPRLGAPEDIVLYELHIRDFSANDPSVPAALKGTYKAFSLDNSIGMRHLRSLADAGLTHIHLLPSFDITSIDEDNSHWQQPAGNLASFPPDSDQQQAAVTAVADQDGFNWGYDPWHYTTPEGSYSTNPDGQTRIKEFRGMVQGLNEAGLRVVMDVVYNHTSAAGEDSHSVLDRVVPGYYHRLNADGNIETSSCCQNTASEFNMMEKLLIDSVLTWAEQYKVDGFRFDLMGHHMKRNIVKLRAALDALTPSHDGIDGKKVYLYGEGWNFGEVADNARGVNAIQRNMAGTGVGTFNDRLRDGARGGGPFSPLQDQGFLTGLWYDPNGTDQGTADAQRARLLQETDWIRTGLAGGLANFSFVDRNGTTVTSSQIDYNGQKAGYTADPQEIINYIEAHDNETLFDTIQEKLPVTTSMSDRVRVQNLGMSLLAFSQGIPFFHAGVELLRSKSLDRNSYNSGDWFNKLDFTQQSNNWGVGLPPARDNQSSWPIQQPLLANPALKPTPSDIRAATDHFREVLAIRQSSKLFRLRTQADVQSHLAFLNTGPSQIPGLIVMALSDPRADVDPGTKLIVVLINAQDQEVAYPYAAAHCPKLKLHPIQAKSSDPVVRFSSFTTATCTFHVPARTAAVFWSHSDDDHGHDH